MKGMEICKAEACTGCFACMNICVKDAITPTEDELGKLIPKIDEGKCVNCGACRRVCPINRQSELTEPEQCFEVYAKDPESIKKCSSGGAAAVFAEAMIDKGGSVFGVSFDENMDCVFSEACDVEAAKQFRGSKYVHSFTGYTYRRVKELLDSGKLVMFTGTSCQTDGLKCYLGREYENLIAVDLMCHGTPPGRYLRDYIKLIAPGRKPDNVSFRGDYNYKLALYEGEELIYLKDRDLDPYFAGFTTGMTLRNNCFSCRYASMNRCSDITIGDFLGRNGLRADNKSLRTSMVLINTQKGRKFFDEVKDSFVYLSHEPVDIRDTNRPLYAPTAMPKDRNKFEKSFGRTDIKTAIMRTSVRSFIFKNKIRTGKPYRLLKRLIGK